MFRNTIEKKPNLIYSVQSKQPIEVPERPWHLKLSPDSKKLFYNTDNSIYSLDLSTLESKKLFHSKKSIFPVSNERLLVYQDRDAFSLDLTNNDSIPRRFAPNDFPDLYISAKNENFFAHLDVKGVQIRNLSDLQPVSLLEEKKEEKTPTSIAFLSNHLIVNRSNLRSKESEISMHRYEDKNFNKEREKISSGSLSKIITLGSKNEYLIVADQEKITSFKLDEKERFVKQCERKLFEPDFSFCKLAFSPHLFITWKPHATHFRIWNVHTLISYEINLKDYLTQPIFSLEANSIDQIYIIDRTTSPFLHIFKLENKLLNLLKGLNTFNAGLCELIAEYVGELEEKVHQPVFVKGSRI